MASLTTKLLLLLRDDEADAITSSDSMGGGKVKVIDDLIRKSVLYGGIHKNETRERRVYKRKRRGDKGSIDLFGPR